MKIKQWFELGTGLNIDKIKPLVTPVFPYRIYVDALLFRGVDERINLIEHDIIVKQYSHEIDEESETIIERFFIREAISFTKHYEWNKDDNCFITTYQLEKQIEKIKELL